MHNVACDIALAAKRIGCVDDSAMSVAHITNDALRAALLAATKLDLNLPKKIDTLSQAVAGQIPEWGDREDICRDIAKTVELRLQSPFWVVGVKTALMLHQLLWRGGQPVAKAIASLSHAVTPSLLPSYANSACGQGLKHEPTVRFMVGLDMMLVSTLVKDTNVATELFKGCRYVNIRTVELFKIPTAVTAFDLPVLGRALDTAAQLNAHLIFVASAIDLDFLAFNNDLAVEVAKCIIHDAKGVYYANYRIFEQIFSIDPATAFIIPVPERKAWVSLYQSFVAAALRMGRLFNDFRGLTINIHDMLPPAEKKFEFPKQRMADYWRKVNEVYNAAAAAAAAGMGSVLVPQTPLAMRETVVPSKPPSGDSDLVMLRAETSPATSHGSHIHAAIADSAPSAPDSFIEGALTEDEDSHSSSSAAVTFASYLESSAPDRYVLGNVLGKGAFGTVYRAFDNETGTFVAIKQLQVDVNESALSRSMSELQSEFKMLTQLSNPHVVTVHGLEVVDGKPRIIMEWMPGGSIQAALKLTRNGFRENIVAKYMKQALQGLAYLHEHNVVHRDIKPGNMLLSSTGEVKLSDFGTSRLLSEVTDSMKTGSVVGTVPFLAPECFTGTYATSSDVWAMGCSALEMLTGRAPWSETNARDSLSLVFLIGNAKPPNHHPKLPEVHPDTDLASPLVFSSSGSMLKSNLGTGNGTISAVARDFLLKCFTHDYRVRPSAVEMLAHEFIVRAAAS